MRLMTEIPDPRCTWSDGFSIDFTCGLRGAATFFDRDDVARFLGVM